MRVSIKRIIPSKIKHLVREAMHRYTINNINIATKALQQTLSLETLRIALYDVENDLLKFPNDLDEAVYNYKYGAIADALPWLKRIDRFVPENGTIFDVGGYRGITSQWFARKAKIVHTFEASPKNVETIELVVSLRRLHNVIVHSCAVSDRVGEAVLNLYAGQGHNSLGRVHTSAYKDRITVPTITLDAFCRDNAVSQIDFMKVDVEGFEVEVFQGASGLLRSKKIGRIIFEVNVPVLSELGRSAETLWDLFHSHGYEIRDLEDNPVDKSRFPSPEYGDYFAAPVS
jgi:FkbM family methyltransferase